MFNDLNGCKCNNMKKIDVSGLENENPTGVFFKYQNVDSICEAVRMFELHREKFSYVVCRQNAEKFSTERFVNGIRDFIKNKV